MPIITSLEIIDDIECNVSVKNASEYYWPSRKTFSFINNPKKNNLFIYISGCKAHYTFKDGREFNVTSKKIVYTPKDLEYSVEFYDFDERVNTTIGISFMLNDIKNRELVLSDDIMILDANRTNYDKKFAKISSLFKMPRLQRTKVNYIFYNILSHIADEYKYNDLASTQFAPILNAIKYLEESEFDSSDEEISIISLAGMCNISTSYFRALFKQYTGMSVHQYIIQNRIAKAKQYLEYDNLSISEIAERLHFIDATYFTKHFKLKVGMTPMEYKKKCKNK